MKKILLLVFICMFAGTALAQDPNAPKKRIRPIAMGKVIVTKDDANNITAVQIKDRRAETTLNVVLDAKGKKLGEKMANKMVAVTAGTIETKGDQKWLTVTEYVVHQRPSGKKGGHGDPNGPPPGSSVAVGKVIVTKDDANNITAVQIKDRRAETTINVVLDAKGKELGEKLANKMVAVTAGTIETKGDQKWLTVTEYIVHKRPSGKKGGQGESNGPPPGCSSGHGGSKCPGSDKK